MILRTRELVVFFFHVIMIKIRDIQSGRGERGREKEKERGGERGGREKERERERGRDIGNRERERKEKR